MSQYQVPEKEDLIQCPFEDAHMIRASRMPYHLIACKKNHQMQDYGVCPFNARHYTLKHQLRAHIASCPDKVYLEQDFKYMKSQEEGGSYFKGNCSVPSYHHDWEVAPSSENWDEEAPVPRTWKIGQSVEEHFSSSVGYVEEKPGPVRLPQRPPQVLQGVGRGRVPPPTTKTQPPPLAATSAPSGGGTQPSEGAPRTPNVSKNPSSVLAYSLSMAGVGRGRGVTPPLQAPVPAVGRAAAAAATDGGALLQSLARGRGRSAGAGVAQSQANGHVGTAVTSLPASQLMDYADPTARSRHSSGGSTSSSASSASRGRLLNGRPRGVNAPPLNGGLTNGVGRGRYQGDASGFVVPNVNNGSGSTSGSGSASASGSGSETKDEDLKVQRKLTKKLREIEMLEKKVQNGIALNEEEKSKLILKDDILGKLKGFRCEA